MRRRHLVALAASVVLLTGGAPQGQVQNLFPNGDFEAPVVSHIGGNMFAFPPPWYSRPLTSIVRVEGPNAPLPTAATGFPGGDATLQVLPRSDASNDPVGQYMRPMWGVIEFDDTFGKRLEMPTDGCIEFGGKYTFSRPDRTSAFLYTAEMSAARSTTALQRGPPTIARSGWRQSSRS